MDAEHWSATPCPAGVRRVALDPLITSGMVASGRLAPLPPDILRVGGEVRPAHSVERGRELSFLPFRSGVFARVHCGFVLHLFLEVLELLAAEAHRVLALGGTLTVLLPHFGDSRSEEIVRSTLRALEACFGGAEHSAYAGPATSFWSDLYQGRVRQIDCAKEQ